MDKAGKKYWNQVWKNNTLPNCIDPNSASFKKYLRNYILCAFHDYFLEEFINIKTRDLKYLEVGCARSIWMQYFAKQFGFKIVGIDYSIIGCLETNKILKREKVNGIIICQDIFQTSNKMNELFNVIFSLGFIEHFENTSECIKVISKMLKPYGKMITIIPNMAGLIGKIQKCLNKDVFDKHVALNLKNFSEAHEKANLKVIKCSYLLFTNFGVINLLGLDEKTLKYKIKSILLFILYSLSVAIWAFEKIFFKLPSNIITSPYLICVSEKSI